MVMTSVRYCAYVRVLYLTGFASDTNSARGQITCSSWGHANDAMENRSSAACSNARCSGDLYNPFVHICKQQELKLTLGRQYSPCIVPYLNMIRFRY